MVRWSWWRLGEARRHRRYVVKGGRESSFSNNVTYARANLWTEYVQLPFT